MGLYGFMGSTVLLTFWGGNYLTCKYLVIKTNSGVCQLIFYFLILGGFLGQSKSSAEFLNIFAIWVSYKKEWVYEKAWAWSTWSQGIMTHYFIEVLLRIVSSSLLFLLLLLLLCSVYMMHNFPTSLFVRDTRGSSLQNLIHAFFNKKLEAAPSSKSFLIFRSFLVLNVS